MLSILLLSINVFSMANSVQHNVIADDVVANPIITNANPPLADLDGFQFSPTERIFSELLNCAFSSTSEGWGDLSKVSEKSLGGDKAEGLRHSPYPYALELSEYPPSCRHRLACTPP